MGHITSYRPIYLEVTRDRYELPLAVAESAWELAKMRHVNVTSILHAVGNREKRQTRKSKYQIVWVEDEPF